MTRLALTIMVLFAYMLPTNALAEDASGLLTDLHDELCNFPVGQVTSDPHALTNELLNVSGDEKIHPYSFENELWLGVAGQRIPERYLIFRIDKGSYVLTNCLPFRAMGRTSVDVDGEDGESMTFGLYDRTPRGYDMFTAIYKLQSGRREFVSAERIDPFLYEAGITTWDKPVEDPWYWAEVRFQLDSGGTRDDIWGFEIDLDMDGVNEIGITSMATHGNAGGSFAFFRRDEVAYRFIGYLGVQTIQVLTPGDDGGMRIRSFGRFDINCAAAITLTNDGLNFQQIEMIKSCEDAAKYERQVAEAEIVQPGRGQFRPSAWELEN